MNEKSGEWLVQVGYKRGRYEKRYTCATRGQADFWYDGLNIHSGYKKRMVDPDGKIVKRYISDHAA